MQVSTTNRTLTEMLAGAVCLNDALNSGVMYHLNKARLVGQLFKSCNKRAKAQTVKYVEDFALMALTGHEQKITIPKNLRRSGMLSAAIEFLQHIGFVVRFVGWSTMVATDGEDVENGWYSKSAPPMLEFNTDPLAPHNRAIIKKLVEGLPEGERKIFVHLIA